MVYNNFRPWRLNCFLDKYSNKKRQAESSKAGKGKGGKGGMAASQEITVGSQVCLATAPLYQVSNAFKVLIRAPIQNDFLT